MTDNKETILVRHNLAEAVGGYIECSCGWPSRQQYDSSEHEVLHIIEDLRNAGILIETTAVIKALESEADENDEGGDEPEGGCWHPIEGCPAACGFGCWLRHPLTPPANHPSSASDDRPATAEVPGRASPDPDGREGAGAAFLGIKSEPVWRNDGEPDSAFCDRGPCWKPRGHDGPCAPGPAGGGDRG